MFDKRLVEKSYTNSYGTTCTWYEVQTKIPFFGWVCGSIHDTVESAKDHISPPKVKEKIINVNHNI